MGVTKTSKGAVSTKKTHHPSVSHLELRAAKKAYVKRHRQAEGTRKTYQSRINGARRWLKSFLEEFKAESPSPLPLSPQPFPTPPLNEESFLRDPRYPVSLGDTPNLYSPHSLSFHLTHKGVIEELSYSSAQGIYSAFKDLWGSRCVSLTFIFNSDTI
jgi:hypothetical protein